MTIAGVAVKWGVPRQTPLSIADWWSLVDEKQQLAAFAVEQRITRQVYELSGFGMEFALKAHIMGYEGLDGWPDRSSRPELYDHNLNRLLRYSGLDLATIPPDIAPNFRLALNWRRDHGYSSAKPSIIVARQIFDATFGAKGAVTWLRTLR
ncbi:hypothetical protein [Jiella sonneratiae]|uniref:Uncharacterized protein n=1 Tax=Jiella sonneratiae TaxID=2816856 RepID=A0ABS3J4T2_9HYPH|nr:hypothetical protein [Jiella sonneratiae]MBO0904681.1 hypothetical protein [Jiella sonneratiae]